MNAILWDIDGTLLDFHAAERAAIRALFDRFGLGTCTDEMLARYSRINTGYWERLERGELTRQQVLLGRFETFFTGEGLDPGIAPAFNDAYQLSLGDTIVYRDDSLKLIRSLRGRIRQYVVSNGTVVAQNKKLKVSGLGALMDGIFLSEELGVEKPNREFFDRVFAATGLTPSDEILIVGDSLTSDMQGGVNAGIATCWYNPAGLPAPDPAVLPLDYIIRDLHEIYGILGLNAD